MFMFAHHMAVELLGHEFSPQTPLQHVCTFLVLGFFLATSSYGTWALAYKLRESLKNRPQVKV